MARLPPSVGPTSLTLFVAGEPKTVPSLRDVVGRGIGRRLSGMFLPGGGLPSNPPPGSAANTDASLPSSETARPAGPSAWHLPPSQVVCFEMVLNFVERQHRSLLVVDVNAPGDHRDLVERWVGAEDVLPLLVRPDGRRLGGEENFVPGRVRRFIAGR